MTPATQDAAKPSKPTLQELNAVLAPYKEPSVARSLGQIADTVVPLFACWAAMHWGLTSGNWWLHALLAPIAAGILMRLFIIQHDCGHGSFFKSQWANDLVGGACGTLTLTPYKYWRQTHAIHHSTSGSLDRRGWGDIDTRTVAEYRAMAPGQRRWYRFYRSFPVLFVFGPLFQFFVYHRFTAIVPPDWKEERLSILRHDLALALLALAAHLTIGLKAALLIYVPTAALSAVIGVWHFYVQHQYEETYWRRDAEWDLVDASFEGSSWYDLPRILQWFTGNIGFHHIHHLNSRIPNYRLEPAMRENAALQRVKRLTLRESLKCPRLALWDEEKRRLVGFDDVSLAGA